MIGLFEIFSMFIRELVWIFANCSWLIITFAAFYGDRNIKMADSIFLAVLKLFLHFVRIFHIYYCQKLFLSISISGSKPRGSIFFVLKTFKKYWTVSFFLNWETLFQNVKLYTFTFVLWNISAHLRMCNQPLFPK